jgi:hypothetical protein
VAEAMSIWVRAFCRKSVAKATPEAMRDGIAQRWASMIFLISTEDDDEPDAVLDRLRIEDHSGGEFRLCHLLYRESSAHFLRAERWTGPASRLEVEESLEELRDREEPAVETVLTILAETVETVGFELSLRDAKRMGFPLAIAAAVWLAEIGNGIAHAEGYGWLLPEGNAALLVLED